MMDSNCLCMHEVDDAERVVDRSMHLVHSVMDSVATGCKGINVISEGEAGADGGTIGQLS